MKRKGFTLVELLVAVVILGIIFIPLVSIMVSSLKTWWLSRTKMNIQVDGREAISYISRELEGAFRYSAGSFVYNGGFEESVLDDGVTRPSGWSLPDEYIFSSSSSTVYSGFGSVRLDDGHSLSTMDSPNYRFSVLRDSEMVFSFKAVLATATATPSVTGEVCTSGGSVILSTGTSSLPAIGWQKFVALGTIPAGDGYWIRITPKNCAVYLDEVSLIPKKAVLISPTEPVNVEQYRYVSQVSRAQESSSQLGYNISSLVIESRPSKSGQTINRLLIYQVTSSLDTIVTKFYNALAENIRKLEFILDSPDSILLEKGPDVPITVNLQFYSPVRGGDPIEYSLRTTVYPPQ